MVKKQKVSDWFEPLKLLAQELANRNSRMIDYAGLDEKSAMIVGKINALIDVIPEAYPHLKSMIPLLQLKKRIVMEIGHANWISHASELTNLGLLVPKKTPELDLTKDLE